MELQTVSQAAIRMGVTERTVQKWAKSGKIFGAKKLGRDWMIPVSATRPGMEINNYKKDITGISLPLTTSDYKVGHCLEYIDTIENEDLRNIALAEYYYFRADMKEAISIAEKYIHKREPHLSFSAMIIDMYSYLSLGDTNKVYQALSQIDKVFQSRLKIQLTKELKSLGTFFSTLLDSEFHLFDSRIGSLEDDARYLVAGLKMYAVYLLAYRACLVGDYSRAYGIAEVGLIIAPKKYPIACIHIHIVMAISCINLMDVNKAKKHIEKAWELAEPEGFIRPFIQHHGMLQGLIEVMFKKEYTDVYKRIIELTNDYNSAWRRIHNKFVGNNITDELTSVEFSVAMLYSKNWRVKEIADYMELSERTIKNYIQSIYEKLNINSKKELSEFML